MFTCLFHNCLAESDGEKGLLSKSVFNQFFDKTALPSYNSLCSSLEKHSALSYMMENHDLSSLEQHAHNINTNFSHVVIVGTGGSILNPRSLLSLVCSDSCSVTIDFLDNIDPFSVRLLFSRLSLDKTCFLFISKSGKTLETLSQFLYCLKQYKHEPLSLDDVGKHIFVINDPGNSPLREAALQINATIIDHVPDIGGRFSSFTNVSLLPALIAGIDVDAYLDGGKACLKHFLDDPKSSTHFSAIISYLLYKKGFSNIIFMPYMDRLHSLSYWLRQIYAESLGKDGDGFTPIAGLGTLDQHSQLQLYLDGPKDKIFVMFNLENAQGSKKDIDFLTPDVDSIRYLHELSMDDVINAEFKATTESLIEHDCPVMSIKLKQLDSFSFGELHMHFMLQVITLAQYFNVNPYDQPAVEYGKRIAHGILSGDM